MKLPEGRAVLAHPVDKFKFVVYGESNNQSALVNCLNSIWDLCEDASQIDLNVMLGNFDPQKFSFIWETLAYSNLVTSKVNLGGYHLSTALQSSFAKPYIFFIPDYAEIISKTILEDCDSIIKSLIKNTNKQDLLKTGFSVNLSKRAECAIFYNCPLAHDLNCNYISSLLLRTVLCQENKNINLPNSIKIHKNDFSFNEYRMGYDLQWMNYPQKKSSAVEEYLSLKIF